MGIVTFCNILSQYILFLFLRVRSSSFLFFFSISTIHTFKVYLIVLSLSLSLSLVLLPQKKIMSQDSSAASLANLADVFEVPPMTKLSPTAIVTLDSLKAPQHKWRYGVITADVMDADHPIVRRIRVTEHQLARRFVYCAPEVSVAGSRHHYRWELPSSVPYPSSGCIPFHFQLPIAKMMSSHKATTKIPVGLELCDLSNIFGTTPLSTLSKSAEALIREMMAFPSDASYYNLVTANNMNATHPLVKLILAIEKQVGLQFVFVALMMHRDRLVAPHYRWEAANSGPFQEDSTVLLDMPAFQSRREVLDEQCDCVAHRAWRATFTHAPPTSVCANDRHCSCCSGGYTCVGCYHHVFPVKGSGCPLEPISLAQSQ